MAELKIKPTEASVPAFLARIENRRRREDGEVLLAMFERITGEPPKMWGPTIIGFGQYHYKYESGREGDICMTGFSPRKANLVLYLLSGFDGQEESLARLGKHKHGKECLYINKLADVDMTVLEDMITRSYRHMQARHPA